MAIYGYIRVSTEGKGQTTDNQKKLISDAGFSVDEFFSEDGVSGSIKALERPAFSRMMAKVQTGDTVIITMVDRLGRSASDILNVVEHLKELGIKLRVLQFDSMDITSSMGKMVLTCMAAMAELERNILIERTHAGLQRTKEQGTVLGPPLTVEPALLRKALKCRIEGLSFEATAKATGIPRNTVHRTLTKWGNDMDGYEKAFMIQRAQHLSKNV